MRTIKTILVPTDFNPASDKALSYARELADAFGATLHVLHVLEDPFPPGTFTEAYPPALDKHLEDMERQSGALLAAALTDEQKVKYSAVQIMRRGMAAEQILAYLNEHPIDLVMMGTAGRGGMSRWIIGSVADRVVRGAPCPVLTVHPADGDAAVGNRAA